MQKRLKTENFKITGDISNVLVLAPHPDDFDAISVTLKLFRDKGIPIYLAVMTGAASGVEDSFCEQHPGKTKVEIREQEQINSCRFFGMQDSHISFLHLEEDENGDPFESDENLEIITTHFMKLKPDVVFLPHGNDTNPGHQRIYSMFRKIADSVDYSLTAYLNRDPKTIQMRNDVYTVFNEKDAQWKRELLRYHDSQHQRNLNTRGHGFDDRILNVNSEIAQKNCINGLYAEAFEIQEFNAII